MKELIHLIVVIVMKSMSALTLPVADSALFDSLFKMILLQLLTIDPALGRLDYDSLPDQTLMEMLFDGLSDDAKRVFHDSNGNFKDVCDWAPCDVPLSGINCRDDHVWYIVFREGKDFGTKQFPFNFIPLNVKVLMLESCGLHGTLDTTLLPRNLEILSVFDNSLCGTIAWNMLPRGLYDMSISTNFFSGRIILADLPRGLDVFYASWNKFSGEIAFSDLPDEIDKIHLTNNQLEGSIRILSPLPFNLSHLYLENNEFCGDVLIMEEPGDYFVIDARGNALSGTVVLYDTAEILLDRLRIYIDRMTVTLDAKGNKHPQDAEIRAKYSEA